MLNELLLDLNISTWADDNVHTESTLHQLSPYIGKIKSSIARILIQKYSKPNDTVLDPFVGSGTIALESLIAKRNIICYDTNPYGVILTKAKINPPKSETEAIEKAKYYLSLAKEVQDEVDLKAIPDWVKKFFHPQTLIETLAFSKILLQENEYFLLSSLLGILHHQRPGFLSYPSSHSVPYLRDKKFPSYLYPELYEYRELEPRILKKIKRVYKRFPIIGNSLIKICEQKNVLNINLSPDSIDTIITSPPYMDTLDYYRDNRIRLWFCGIEYENKELYPNPKNLQEFKDLIVNVLDIFNKILKPEGKCVLIIGDVNRSCVNGIINTGKIVIDILQRNEDFVIEGYLKDKIHKQISYRSNINTKEKEEWIIVIRKKRI